jgi:hypothetical protein
MAVNRLRAINTTEAVYRAKHGVFGNREALLEDEDCL